METIRHVIFTKATFALYSSLPDEAVEQVFQAAVETGTIKNYIRNTTMTKNQGLYRHTYVMT